MRRLWRSSRADGSVRMLQYRCHHRGRRSPRGKKLFCAETAAASARTHAATSNPTARFRISDLELYLDEALPEGTLLTGVRLEGDLAVVDVTKPFAAELPSGSSAEMLAVYSIVNTVCFNYPQITRVRITVEGAPAILNHLDLSDPLPPDYSLEREATSTNMAAPVTPPAPAAKKGHP